MHRSDRIYLSKFALDPDPEYLDLDDFDLDYQPETDEYFDETIPQNARNMSTEIRRLPSNEN